MDLHQLIKDMHSNVLLYIQSYDINRLSRFLSGYLVRKRDMNISLTKEEKNFRDKFTTWVRIYYRETKFNTTVEGFILLHSNGSHYNAIKKFFELYKMWYQKEFNEEPW